MYTDIKEDLIELSLSMFRKNFFGIFHGSISAKLVGEKFIINTKDAIFDEMKEEDFITIYFNKDYRYKTASIDSHIHRNIYQNISDAKYICYSMPPNIISHSLNHDTFIPKDYFGSLKYEKLPIYNPENFKDWYDRAPDEITTYFKEYSDIMIIKGYGIYTYSRDLKELVKKVAIIENSAKILLNSQKKIK
jgi:L-fuculose-phosphate aldolase